MRLPDGACPTTRVRLTAGTLVITDLHLAPLGDERTGRFVQLCDQLEGVPALVCLGDLFDMWVCRRQANMEGSVPVFDAFERLTPFAPGTRVTSACAPSGGSGPCA